MKRTSSAHTLPTELTELAIGLAESGSRFEDDLWTRQLTDVLNKKLHQGAEDDIVGALEELFKSRPEAHDALADSVEYCAESLLIDTPKGPRNILLFAAPILAWSRYAIPSGPIAARQMAPIETHLAAHVFARHTDMVLLHYLFSPDQLPQSFCDTRKLTETLGQALAKGVQPTMDLASFPETNRFLSDIRYLVGAIAFEPGTPLFRWNESGGSRNNALDAWIKQGGPNIEPLLTGCMWSLILPDAYHNVCRQADQASRPYSIQASTGFLATTLGLEPQKLRAVVAPYDGGEIDEYRVSFGPKDSNDIYYGVIWPVMGSPSVNGDSGEATAEIEQVLKDCGIQDIVFLDNRFPSEFCDDCGAPLYPNVEGESVHAELPEESETAQTLH